MKKILTRSSSFLKYMPKTMKSVKAITEPDKDSFFIRAFNANIDIANAVVNTQYLQKMKTGILDPSYYGCLTVLDSYYCYRAAETLGSLLNNIDKSKYPDLHNLVEANQKSYREYNKTFLVDWHILQSDSVVPTDKMKRYAEHEHNVMCYQDPIYTLVAYIPCYYLWPWFSKKIIEDSNYKPGVYDLWFKGNYYGEDSFGSAWTIGNFIESWKKSGNAFDETLASDIFKKSMQFELDVFTDAYKE
jgi:thiaminase/transcriptional activator TenA